jgi:hypothetical protein
MMEREMAGKMARRGENEGSANEGRKEGERGGRKERGER